MVKRALYGVNTYVRRTKPKIGRHKKRMNKSEKEVTSPHEAKGDNGKDRHDHSVYFNVHREG